MLKEFMFCPVNVDRNVVPPSVVFKDEFSLKDFHSNNIEQVYIKYVFHFDGLLLCTTTDNRLVVWNPCVGEIRWIQYNNSYEGCNRFALGYENTKSGRAYKIVRYGKQIIEIKTSRPVVEIYEFASGSWRVLDDVTLDNFKLPKGCVSVKGNTYWATNLWTADDFLRCFDFTEERYKRLTLPQLTKCYGWNVLSVVGEEKLAVLYLSILTSSIDMWVTNKIDTDTEVALTWSKCFTLNRIKCLHIPMSFVLDEEKKMALFCSRGKELTVYSITEDERCYYRSIPCEEESKNPSMWPYIFNYVPSLLQIHQ